MKDSYLMKTYVASMPINKYSDNTLRLCVYGSAYVDFYKLQSKYTIINVEERFYNNDKAETRTLSVILTLTENNKIN